jgi:hypothetical protein
VTAMAPTWIRLTGIYDDKAVPIVVRTTWIVVVTDMLDRGSRLTLDAASAPVTLDVFERFDAVCALLDVATSTAAAA